MRINKGLIRTLVKEDGEDKIKMKELIDLTLFIFSDTTKEHPNMDVINNAKKNVVDSFQTNKWFLHKIQDLKYRVSSLERKNYSLKNRISEEEKNKDDKVEQAKNRVQTMESSKKIIVEQSYNILKETNENIKILINKIKE